MKKNHVPNLDAELQELAGELNKVANVCRRMEDDDYGLKIEVCSGMKTCSADQVLSDETIESIKKLITQDLEKKSDELVSKLKSVLK